MTHTDQDRIERILLAVDRARRFRVWRRRAHQVGFLLLGVLSLYFLGEAAWALAQMAGLR